jgi:hypothetical protein
MKIVDATKIKITNEDSKHFNKFTSKPTFLMCIGTAEGKILIQKYGGQTSTSSTKLYKSKGGIAYGGISAIDVTPTGTDIVAATESGEMIQFDLLKKLNDE